MNELDIDKLLSYRELPDLPEARAAMIERLAKRSDVDPRVLEVMGAIPRHAFAPRELWRVAYAESELWAPSAFLPSARAVARIATALATLASKQRWLEYAAGTGYTASVLSQLSNEIYCVEHDPWLLWSASEAFRLLGCQNVSQRASDGRLGWPEKAPFDGIVLSAGVPVVPRVLLDQLAPDGCLIAPVGPYGGPFRLTLARKMDGELRLEDLGSHFYPPLTGAWLSGVLALPGLPLRATAGSEGFADHLYGAPSTPAVSNGLDPDYLRVIEGMEGSPGTDQRDTLAQG